MWAHYSAPRRNCAVHARQKPPQKRHRNWGAYYDGKRPVPQSTTIYTVFVFSIFIYTSLTNFELIIKYLNITIFFYCYYIHASKYPRTRCPAAAVERSRIRTVPRRTFPLPATPRDAPRRMFQKVRRRRAHGKRAAALG